MNKKVEERLRATLSNDGLISLERINIEALLSGGSLKFRLDGGTPADLIVDPRYLTPTTIGDSPWVIRLKGRDRYIFLADLRVLSPLEELALCLENE